MQTQAEFAVKAYNEWITSLIDSQTTQGADNEKIRAEKLASFQYWMTELQLALRGAKLDDKWGNFDIADLTKESLLEWLRSRGGENKWAEDTVGILLGHGALND